MYVWHVCTQVVLETLQSKLDVVVVCDSTIGSVLAAWLMLPRSKDTGQSYATLSVRWNFAVLCLVCDYTLQFLYVAVTWKTEWLIDFLLSVIS